LLFTASSSTAKQGNSRKQTILPLNTQSKKGYIIKKGGRAKKFTRERKTA
jgi:hypothetical protein